MAIDRFAIAAVTDRLIYGGETTFARADAIALLDLVPPARRGRFLGITLRGRSSSGSTSGFAAGVGQVAVPGDGGTIEFDSRGRDIVRAGQWKLHRGGDRRIEIEQVMSDDDEGRVARLEYRGGEPLRMRVLAYVRLPLRIAGFGAEISFAVFRHWKDPVP